MKQSSITYGTMPRVTNLRHSCKIATPFSPSWKIKKHKNRQITNANKHTRFSSSFDSPSASSLRPRSRFAGPEMSPPAAEDALHTVLTVAISCSDLKDGSLDLSKKIEDGFGPDGLGIISVFDVPGYPLLRQKLLTLSPRLASLPENVKKELEDPDSRYSFGWSHGKEMLESGKLDTAKGSFFANPILDVPTTETSLIQRYPSYCRPNRWPVNALPELEGAFKELGKLMMDVGLLLAYHCDQYVSRDTSVIDEQRLESTIKRSRCHKGRLLYYFPKQQIECTEDVQNLSSWCGWHTDYGSLTGLTSAMYLRNFEQIECPGSAGLYIKTRNGEIVKVTFGEDEIAYQIGETAEVLSRGRLCATPHCVKAPNGENALGVERSTFALFMQPNWDENLNLSEVPLHQELIPSNGSITFGEYSEKLLDNYYHRLP